MFDFSQVGPASAFLPYPLQFSTDADAKSAKDNAFHLVPRKTEKCADAGDWHQKGSRCAVVYAGEDPEILSRNKREIPCDDFDLVVESTISDRELDFLKTPEGIVHLNRKGASLAVKKRVLLFLQEAIVCHGMSNFVFSCRHADAQIGHAPPLTLYSDTNKSVTFRREAAHSSTIPTLIAHAKDGSTPEGIVYLKGGSSYYQHQATVGMHKAINRADILIDGKKDDGKLREIAVGLLNRVADGLSPIRATEEFCAAFRRRCVQEARSLSGEKVEKAVLNFYKRKIEKIEFASATNPAFYDYLLGIAIDPSDRRETQLRQAVYQKRFDVIRLQEVVENRIGKRIADVQKKMSGAKAALLEHALLLEFSETSERTVLERLFGKTLAYLEADLKNAPRGFKTFRTQVEKLRVEYRRDLDRLKRDMRSDFRELSRAEFTYRAGLFKSLRTEVNNWYQREFCEEYLKTTGREISQAWVSRMEQLSRLPTKAVYQTPLGQRRRYITIEDGIDCARTFGVAPGLFLSSLFNSR